MPADGDGNVELAIVVTVATEYVLGLKFVVGQFAIQNVPTVIAVDFAIGPRT